MSKTKTGLGRGLDALINPNFKKGVDEKITIATSEIKQDDGRSLDVLAKIPIKNISPNPYQPRSNFESEPLDELKKSILENGLIQPITVRRHNKHYELISGERRFRACQAIGYREIPAYIIKVETKEAMLALSLIENIQREKLNPIEIAKAYKRLLDECGLSQENIAVKVGKDRTTITNTIRLLKLPDEIQASLITGEITQGHARAILGISDNYQQILLLKKIIKEQLSVRKLEKLVHDKISKRKQTAKQIKIKTDLSEISNRDIENKLRGIFGTKVICKQKKDGTGNITIEFYSNDELERLFELFDIIEKNYS